MLCPYFGGIIGFVKDVEPLLERGQRDKIRVDEREYDDDASIPQLCLLQKIKLGRSPQLALTLPVSLGTRLVLGSQQQSPLGHIQPNGMLSSI